MNKKCIVSFITIFLLSIHLIFYFILSISQDVNADIGAKPSISITIENGPDEYFVALLEKRDYGIENTVETSTDVKVENVTEESVYNFLKSFRYDGYLFFESPVGSNVKKSDKNENPEEIYHFTYMVPSDFRVILIDKDGNLYLSESHTKKEFKAICTYDVATSSIVEEEGKSRIISIITIIICFILTLVIEFLILIAFRYPLIKRNVLVFLLTNALTNIPYNIFLISTVSRIDVMLILINFFAEIIITLIETLVYCFTLVNREKEVKYGKNILYGILANIASSILGSVVIILACIIMNM